MWPETTNIFNGTTGKLIKSNNVSITDTGAIDFLGSNPQIIFQNSTNLLYVDRTATIMALGCLREQ